jgi:UDP-N-acetylmuramyl pentapeptide phosphotransferase/UDP-N-acetylglucosamine-1-phosphate transferase
LEKLEIRTGIYLLGDPGISVWPPPSSAALKSPRRVVGRCFLPRPSGILLLAVFFHVSFSRFFSVISGMDGVTTCGVSMMCRFLVMPTVVVLRRFFVVSGSVGMVFGSLPVMLSCFLRHNCPPCSDRPPQAK